MPTRPPFSESLKALTDRQKSVTQGDGNMSKKSFGQEYAETVIAKAVVAAPAIVWGIALGPVGVAAGVVVTAAALSELASSDGDSVKNASGPKYTGPR
jgi:hypothetical protein